MKNKTIEAVFFLIVITAVAGFLATQRMVLHAAPHAAVIQNTINDIVTDIVYNHFREANDRRLEKIPFKSLAQFRSYLDSVRIEERPFSPPGSDQTFLEIFNQHMEEIEKEATEVLDLRVTKYIKDIEEVRPQIIRGIAEKRLDPFLKQVDRHIK